MQKSLINFKRNLYDFIFTLFLTVILCMLFMMVINLTIWDISYSIGFSVLIIALIISFFHWLLCRSDIYFWKFAFLLPGDVFYYIIASNSGPSCIQDEEITVKLPEGSLLIRSKPDHKCHESTLKDVSRYRDDFRRILKDYKCHHACRLADELASHISKNCTSSERSLWKNRTGKLSSGESESYVIWLHTKKDRTLIPEDIKNKYLDLTINHCDWDYGDFGRLDSFYLLLSKNVILLLMRLLVLSFLILSILMQNPPLNIVTDPIQIEENWTEAGPHVKMISIKNIGCDLSDVELMNAVWIPENTTKKNLPSGSVGLIKLSMSSDCPSSELRGSIIITAKAERNLVPDLLPDYTLIPPISCQTYIKKLAEVPFFIRIMTGPNAEAYCANGKLKQ